MQQVTELFDGVECLALAYTWSSSMIKSAVVTGADGTPQHPVAQVAVGVRKYIPPGYSWKLAGSLCAWMEAGAVQ